MLASDRSLASRNRLLTHTCIGTGFAGEQLDLNDLATHFLDALLFTEPVVVRHQLCEKGIL